MPYHHYTLKSPLNPQEIADILNSQIRAERDSTFNRLKGWFGSDNLNGTWYGVADRHSFKIYRHINYRNSFLPIIHGEIQRRSGGSHIVITMRLQLVVMVFLLIYFCILIYSFIPMTDISESMIFVGMFLFACALTIGGFVFEVKKAKALLQEQLQARPLY